MKNSIAIVILNWNGKDLLKTFLPSVVNFSQEATIYLADNASNDNSIAFLKQEFPEVKIIQNPENFGFSKGYNEALKQVDEELLCLLNSDVEVTENWLQPIIPQEFSEIFAGLKKKHLAKPKSIYPRLAPKTR